MSQVLKLCLNALSDGRIRRLLRHINKGTAFLCGCDQAGDYFVHDGRCDPVILACYENGYPAKEVTYHELHPDTQKIYDDVASRVPHSGYANALQECTQWDLKQIIRQIAEERGL